MVPKFETDLVEVSMIPSASDVTVTSQSESLTGRLTQTPLTKPVASVLTDGITVLP